MQDRFKFRAYNTITGEFFKKIDRIGDYSDIVGDNGKSFSFIGYKDFHSTLYCVQPKENWVIMQCSGKKDRYNTLMYEGDRVYIAREEEYATIEWSDDLARFVIHFEDEKVVADFDNYYDKELEVVGNIYEDKQC